MSQLGLYGNMRAWKHAPCQIVPTSQSPVVCAKSITCDGSSTGLPNSQGPFGPRHVQSKGAALHRSRRGFAGAITRGISVMVIRSQAALQLGLGLERHAVSMGAMTLSARICFVQNICLGLNAMGTRTKFGFVLSALLKDAPSLIGRMAFALCISSDGKSTATRYSEGSLMGFRLTQTFCEIVGMKRCAGIELPRQAGCGRGCNGNAGALGYTGSKLTEKPLNCFGQARHVARCVIMGLSKAIRDYTKPLTTSSPYSTAVPTL